MLPNSTFAQRSKLQLLFEMLPVADEVCLAQNADLLLSATPFDDCFVQPTLVRRGHLPFTMCEIQVTTCVLRKCCRYYLHISSRNGARTSNGNFLQRPEQAEHTKNVSRKGK